MLKVKLEPVDPSRYPALYSWRSDPSARLFNPFTPCDFPSFSRKLAAAGSDVSQIYEQGECKWMVVMDDEVAALAGAGEINPVMKTAEISYQVAPELRGRGIGGATVRALVEKLFSGSDLRKLIAFVADGNVPSCRILEATGFVQEGFLRKHFLIEGRETDERLYGLLREEWLAIRAARSGSRRAR